MVTPHGKGKLEANSKDALGDLVCAFAEGMRVVVEARRVGGIRRVVPPHVEALHRCGP